MTDSQHYKEAARAFTDDAIGSAGLEKLRKDVFSGNTFAEEPEVRCAACGCPEDAHGESYADRYVTIGSPCWAGAVRSQDYDGRYNGWERGCPCDGYEPIQPDDSEGQGDGAPPIANFEESPFPPCDQCGHRAIKHTRWAGERTYCDDCNCASYEHRVGFSRADSPLLPPTPMPNAADSLMAIEEDIPEILGLLQYSGPDGEFAVTFAAFAKTFAGIRECLEERARDANEAMRYSPGAGEIARLSRP